MKDNVLNIANTYYPCETLGPGTRFCIWVQGCHFNCYKCISPKYQPFEERLMLSSEELADIIIAKPTLDGITISGGEPFEQAEQLSLLINLLKTNNPALNYICYTGYSYEALVKNKNAQKLLDSLDVLITDPYIHNQNSDLGIRGSDNQRIFHLTNKLSDYDNYFKYSQREIDCIIRNNELEIIGIPGKDFKLNT